MMGWAGATVAGGAVDFAKTTDADGFAEVDVACDGSGADVEPIDGLGREFLSTAGLDGINPAWRNRISMRQGQKTEGKAKSYRGWEAFPVSSRKQSMPR